MAISFPLSPSSGEQYSSGARTWVWNGSVWVLDSDTFSAPFISADLDDINDVLISPATYAIGDTGPAGGKIFITPSTAGNATGKYFEAAPVSAEVTRSWATGGNQSTVVSGADGTAIGTGAQNTIDIVAQSGNDSATSAAAYASEYEYGGFSDWFLPSQDELAQLRANRVIIGGFSSVYYASSSEFDAEYAWLVNFVDGSYEPIAKYNEPFVRPVRSFKAFGNGDLLQFNGTNWVNAPGPTISTPKIYVEKFTDWEDNQWTCPAGVTRIKLTLIGAGGGCGNSEAITAFSSASFGSPGGGEPTTFTVGETIYSAAGGTKGANHSVTGPYFSIYGVYGQIGSGSSASSDQDTDYTRYPGCGGSSTRAFASTSIYYSDGVDGFADHISRAYARSERGQDGLTEVFQVTVTPGTTYAFSIGLADAFFGYFITDANMGSNGAVIIEYVI